MRANVTGLMNESNILTDDFIIREMQIHLKFKGVNLYRGLISALWNFGMEQMD